MPVFGAEVLGRALQLRRTNAQNEQTRRGTRTGRGVTLEDPEKPSYRNLIAVILSRIGEYERSSEYYESLVDDYPDNPKIWLSYAHVLKTEGKRSECEAAYRRAIALQPNFGEAYWSLANLKTFRFDENDINTMRQSVLDVGTELNSRVQFHFALGKAAEDAKDHERSFEQYSQGNELHASTLNYSAEKNTRRMLRMKSSFTREFFDERASWAAPIQVLFLLSVCLARAPRC